MFLNHKNKNRPKWPTCYKQQTQGCRFGPESSRQNLVSPMGPIFRSMLGTSFGGLFPKMLFGDKSTKFECVIPNSWKISSRLAITKVYLFGLTNMTRGKLTTFVLWIHLHSFMVLVVLFSFPAGHMLDFRKTKSCKKIRETGIVSQESPTFSCGFFFQKNSLPRLRLPLTKPCEEFLRFVSNVDSSQLHWHDAYLEGSDKKKTIHPRKLTWIPKMMGLGKGGFF